jgi:hypothetical protein
MSSGYLKKIKNKEPPYMGISKPLKNPRGLWRNKAIFEMVIDKWKPSVWSEPKLKSKLVFLLCEVKP